MVVGCEVPVVVVGTGLKSVIVRICDPQPTRATAASTVIAGCGRARVAQLHGTGKSVPVTAKWLRPRENVNTCPWRIEIPQPAKRRWRSSG